MARNMKLSAVTQLRRQSATLAADLRTLGGLAEKATVEKVQQVPKGFRIAGVARNDAHVRTLVAIGQPRV